MLYQFDYFGLRGLTKKIPQSPGPRGIFLSIVGFNLDSNVKGCSQTTISISPAGKKSGISCRFGSLADSSKIENPPEFST